MSSFISKFVSKFRKKYEVYLSFCYQDSRSFVFGIYTALTSEPGVVVYWDDQWFGSEDRRSKQPSDSTLNVIGDCEIVVIVFSMNYFNSRWCVQELEKITECCRGTTDGPIVLPFFYDGVYPSYNLLKPTHMYGDGFQAFLNRISTSSKDEDEDKFMTWVAAITNQASKYHELDYFGFGNEEEDYIMYAVNFIICVRNKWRGPFSNYCTGSIYSGAQDVIQLLKQSKSPLLLGIWGMTGIGKSTIATAIYYQIGFFFEHKYFLDIIEEDREKSNSQVFLQKQLLRYIDNTTEIKIPTAESGRVILKERLQHKRILLILDGVDKLEHLQALCGNKDWFGPGSKIIITTTNRHLLKEHGVDHICRVKELDESESLKLFNSCAFRKASSRKGFTELSKQIVAYYGALPLALKELGKFLRGKQELEWKPVLRSLEQFSIPAPRLLEAPLMFNLCLNF